MPRAVPDLTATYGPLVQRYERTLGMNVGAFFFAAIPGALAVAGVFALAGSFGEGWAFRLFVGVGGLLVGGAGAWLIAAQVLRNWDLVVCLYERGLWHRALGKETHFSWEELTDWRRYNQGEFLLEAGPSRKLKLEALAWNQSDEVASFVFDAFVDRHLPAYEARLAAGETLRFDELELSREGVTVAGVCLPWDVVQVDPFYPEWQWTLFERSGPRRFVVGMRRIACMPVVRKLLEARDVLASAAATEPAPSP